MAIVSLQPTHLTLRQLPKGVAARVTGVEGADAEVARLAELGLLDGAIVSVVRCGRPCIVQVNTARICVRTSGDVTVWVTPLD